MVLFEGDQDNSRRSEPPIPTSPTSPTSPVSASGSTKSIPGAVGGADVLVWVKAVSGGKVGECAQIKRDCLTKRQQIVDDSSESSCGLNLSFKSGADIGFSKILSFL